VTRSAIIVLGMHRSGTSCLAGTLEQAGLHLGEVNRKAPHNAKGNRENREIMDLNDAILLENNASWDRPPTTPTIWREAHYEERDRILASYPNDCIIGFKEPRSLFVLDGWLEALPDARLVGTFRHPVAVAKSLSLRNRFSRSQGLKLWHQYNSRLLMLCDEHDIWLINFDWPTDVYRNALNALCEDLGLSPPTEGLDFFDVDLRHNSPPQELPEGIFLEVYRALASRSATLLRN
jgi:hypothetical protein